MKKRQIIIVVIISIVLSFVMIFVNSKKKEFVVLDKSQEEIQDIDINQVKENEINYDIKQEKNPQDDKTEQVVVYISGEVENPHVIEMNKGDRLIDAVKKCGGFTKEADKNRVNLALILKDEQHYIIPKIGEEIPNATNEILAGENVLNDSKLVNINTADATKLKTLPGIGDKTADKIIQYRKTAGEFKSIEDIKNVGGIGDKKFEQIESLITV